MFARHYFTISWVHQTCVQQPHLGLKKSGCCSKVVIIQRLDLKNYVQHWKAGDHTCHCIYVAIVQRWSLTQVWLYSQTCPNNHLPIAATCQQWPAWSHNYHPKAYLPLIFFRQPSVLQPYFSGPKAGPLHRFNCSCKKNCQAVFWEVIFRAVVTFPILEICISAIKQAGGALLNYNYFFLRRTKGHSQPNWKFVAKEKPKSIKKLEYESLFCSVNEDLLMRSCIYVKT
jgi:hypothetical protein